MRRFSCFCFAGWVLLQAGAALAQSNTNTIYNINFNENGPGATYDSLALTGSGFYTPTTPLTVVSGGLGSGLTYELPYTINTPGHAASNQYEGIYLNDGSTKSDLVSFYNSGGNGYMTVYSDDVGYASSVSPATWAAMSASVGLGGDWDGYTTSKIPDGTYASFTSYNDDGGVPGDPVPHPFVEANYNGTFNAVPEPTSLALLGVFAGMGLVGLAWRGRKPA